MLFLIILIILIFAWPHIWRWLQPYFYRWARRRTEDYMRRAMGMPPHGRGQSRGRKTSGYGNASRGNARTSSRRRHKESGPLIPKEYAEDVEYTEIHSYSEESTIASDGARVSYVRESQVSDAEIIEIKKN